MKCLPWECFFCEWDSQSHANRVFIYIKICRPDRLISGVGDGEIPLIGEMSEGQKGLGKAVPSCVPSYVP